MGARANISCDLLCYMQSVAILKLFKSKLFAGGDFGCSEIERNAEKIEEKWEAAHKMSKRSKAFLGIEQLWNKK